MSTKIEERLREIEARANAATPGPWRKNCPDIGCGMPVGADNRHLFAPYEYGPERDEDEAFFLAAREDIPFLLAELRKTRAALKDLIVARDGLKGTAPYYDPCGRQQVVYEITRPTFEALDDAFDKAREALGLGEEGE